MDKMNTNNLKTVSCVQIEIKTHKFNVQFTSACLAPTAMHPVIKLTFREKRLVISNGTECTLSGAIRRYYIFDN